MDTELRMHFDEQMEQVLLALPNKLRQLVDDTPVIVEDYPSPMTLKQFGIKDRAQLCGLYHGVPLTKRSVELSGIPSDVVYLFREGILSMAQHRRRAIDDHALREQIRITLLHELGHLHGLNEEELEEMGYG